jgi:hypothetical protein
MDTRWSMSSLDEAKNYKIYLQPTASIETVQAGMPDDAVDISAWVSNAVQTAEGLTVTLDFNTEFTDSNTPFSEEIINVTFNDQNLFIGVIDSISSYNVSFGHRSMTIIARTRETRDIWKLVKYITQSYPRGSNLLPILQDVCIQVGMSVDEILVPVTSASTSHSNTQLANICAWDMVQQLMLPMGLLPFIDCIGRLKGADKNINSRSSDYVYTEERLVSVQASRSRPPTTRYILQWLDPNLTKSEQLDRKLGEFTLTAGFFTPLLWKHVTFSSDGTQRAENTYLHVNTSVNQFRIGGTTFLPCFLELWNQDTDIDGRIMLVTLGWTYVVLAEAMKIKLAAAAKPDGVVVSGIGASGGVTVPTGRLVEAAADIAIFTLLAAMGTGDYEVWGTPFDYVHAKNTSEAYDQNAVSWADNPVTVECDLIMNEEHARAVCSRELIYLSAAATQWAVTIVEDRRIERGDIIEFSDSSKMFVQDFSRNLSYGTPNTLEVKGFLI